LVTIGGGVALILIGAILKFAVTWKPANVDLQAVGVILMIGGAALLGFAIWLRVSQRRSRMAAEVYEERRYSEPPQ